MLCKLANYTYFISIKYFIISILTNYIVYYKKEKNMVIIIKPWWPQINHVFATP